MSQQNEIGKYLAARRKEKKLTLSEVGNMLGLSAGYISRFERGSSIPTQEMINKLCMVYGVDSLELMDEDGEIIPENIEIGENIIELINFGKVSYKGKPIDALDRMYLAKITKTLLEIEDLDKKKHYVEIMNNLYELMK